MGGGGEGVVFNWFMTLSLFIHKFVTSSWGYQFVGKVGHWNPRILIPHEKNNDSTVFLNDVFFLASDGWLFWLLFWHLWCFLGWHLEFRNHSHRTGQRGTPKLRPPSHEGPVPDPQEQPPTADGELLKTLQGVCRTVPQ